MMSVRLPPLLLMSVIAVLAVVTSGFLWHRAADANEALRQANARADSTEAMIKNVQYTLKIFNDITQGRADEKERDRQEGETRRTALRNDLQGDRCAVVFVPAAAERRLLDRAARDRARAVPGTTGGNPATHTGALPAVKR